MKAFRITETGNFMAKLLSGNAFDTFLLEEASVQMAVLWETDGHLNRNFFSDEEWEDPEIRPYDLVQWQDVRPYLREIIKGTKAPSSFRFVFHVKPEICAAILKLASSEELLSSISAMVLTVRYDGSAVTLVTGISVRTFTMDRSAEKIWDEAVQRFLIKKEIEFEPL